MVLAAITSVIVLIFPRQVFGIFTKDPSVQEMGVVYLRILVIHLFLSALTSTFQAMVIGSGFASLNFAIGILDGVVFKVGLALVLVYGFHLGIYGYWWGTAFSRLVPGLVCLGYFLSGKWKTRRLLSEKK